MEEKGAVWLQLATLEQGRRHDIPYHLPPAPHSPKPRGQTPRTQRASQTRSTYLSNFLLNVLVLRINFLYLCFFIFSRLCLFTLMAYILRLLSPTPLP